MAPEDSDYDPDDDDDVASDRIDDDAPGPSRKRGAAPVANGKKDDVSEVMNTRRTSGR
jgi:hypothetical protein